RGRRCVRRELTDLREVRAHQFERGAQPGLCGALLACAAPQFAQGCGVESVCLEELAGGGQVRFSIGDAPLARERRQEQLMRVAIEWRELQPLIYIGRRGIMWQRAREVFEQHGLDAPETPALCRDPGIEHRAA